MSVEELAVYGTAVDYGVYEQEALRLVKYDDDSRATIGGVSVEERMHIGVFEEWSEIFGGDYASTDHTYGYSRIDALMGGSVYTDTFRDSPRGVEQVELHTKEFGDSLWYVTNYLALFGISLDEAMRDIDYDFEAQQLYEGAMLENTEDAQAYPAELNDFIECGWALFTHMGAIFQREEASMSLDKVSEYTLKQLARRYVESMSVVVASTFGITLEEVMVANLEKISGRWRNNTVLGSGDSR